METITKNILKINLANRLLIPNNFYTEEEFNKWWNKAMSKKNIFDSLDGSSTELTNGMLKIIAEHFKNDTLAIQNIKYVDLQNNFLTTKCLDDLMHIIKSKNVELVITTGNKYLTVPFAKLLDENTYKKVIFIHSSFFEPNAGYTRDMYGDKIVDWHLEFYANDEQCEQLLNVSNKPRRLFANSREKLDEVTKLVKEDEQFHPC